MTEHTPPYISHDDNDRWWLVFSENGEAYDVDNLAFASLLDVRRRAADFLNPEALRQLPFVCATDCEICRAVNCHDDLLAALEGCEAYLTEYQKITKSTLFDLSQARAAIAKARQTGG